MRNKDVNQSVKQSLLTTFPTFPTFPFMSYSHIEKYSRISVFFLPGKFSSRNMATLKSGK
jgi:hypothetical protein